MIGRGGDVKIMDFGIAKAHARATQTATGTIKGKVAYMAPEHASGEAADARSDQFSLGAVLWEALAGERLYRGESELELFRDVIGHRTRDLRGFRDDLPEELVEIVERTITREPGERFSDLDELGTALSHFRFSLGTKGAVRLGVLFSELEEHGARTVETPSQSGTLVLEDDGAVASAETASLADESGGLPATASLADQDVLRSGPATQPLEPPTPTGATLSYDQTGAHEAKAAVHSSGRSKLGLGAAGLMVAALITAVAVGMGPERATQASGAEQIEAKRSGLRVVSLPAGAKLRIDGANHEGVTPVSVEGLEAGRTLKLEVELEGYEIWRQNVTVTREVLQVDVALLERVTARGAEAAGAADAKSAEKVEIESKGGKRVSVKPRARPRVPNARKPETKAAKAAAVKPSARLDLRSAGAWYDVYLGKVRLGTTPLRGVAIPAGRHTLRLVNDGAGLSRTIDIVAEPGGRVRHTVGSD
jgi:serine/threonine-protein kinase